MFTTIKNFQRTGIPKNYTENATILRLENLVYYAKGDIRIPIDVQGDYEELHLYNITVYNMEWNVGVGARSISIGGSVNDISTIKKIICKNVRFVRSYKGFHIEYIVNEELLIEDMLFLNSKPSRDESFTPTRVDSRPIFVQNGDFIKAKIQNILAVDFLADCGGSDAMNVLDSRATDRFEMIGLIYICPNSLRAYPDVIGGCVVIGDIAVTPANVQAALGMHVSYCTFIEWLRFGCQLVDEHLTKSSNNSFNKNIVLLKARNSSLGVSGSVIQFDADLAFSNDLDGNMANDSGSLNNIAVDDGNITTPQKVERNSRNSFKNKSLTDYMANLSTNLPIRQLLG
jgi:hypothetical protein